MSPELVLAAVIILPILLLMALKINASIVFLSVCLGAILEQNVASGTGSILAILHAGDKLTASNLDSVKIGLLILPVFLTMLFMVRTVRNKAKLLMNLLPATGVGLLLAFLLVPILPAGLGHNVVQSKIWSQLHQAQAIIIGASSLVSLLMVWQLRPKSAEGKHAKHKG